MLGRLQRSIAELEDLHDEIAEEHVMWPLVIDDVIRRLTEAQCLLKEMEEK